MEASEFNERLKELSSMTAREEATELFIQEYGFLLRDVSALPGPRYEMAKRMKRLLDHQLEFQMNRWLAASRDQVR